MAGGAFLMSREIFDNDIWSDVTKFRIFFFIVGNAVFAEEGVKKAGVHIKRGQYLRSLRNLREDLVYYERNAEKMYGMATLNRKIAELVEEERLVVEQTKVGTLFTVLNYELYQGFERYKKDSSEQQRNSNGTAAEQQRNNNNNVNKDIKDINDNNKPPKRAKRIYENDSDEMKLVDFFISEIRKNDPMFKEPNKQTWCDEFRKLIEIDGRDKRQIAELIRWVQQDDFEKANVLSPTKLRKRYANLIIKMTTPKKVYGNRKEEKVPDWFYKRNQVEPESTDNTIDFEQRRQAIKEKMAKLLEGG